MIASRCDCCHKVKPFHVVAIVISDVYILSYAFAHTPLSFLKLKTQVFEARWKRATWATSVLLSPWKQGSTIMDAAHTALVFCCSWHIQLGGRDLIQAVLCKPLLKEYVVQSTKPYVENSAGRLSWWRGVEGLSSLLDYLGQAEILSTCTQFAICPFCSCLGSLEVHKCRG